MATVQIAFTDNSDNEDLFTIYRSADGAAVTSVAATEAVATVTWNTTNSIWDIASGVVDSTASAAFVGAAPTADPSTTNSFTVQYEESNAGTYIYGVEAENGIGKSATTSAAGAITIT